MAVKLSPAGAFGKWVVVPALLALMGYFVLGPRIGKSAGLDPKRNKSTASAPDKIDSPAVETQQKPKHVKNDGPDLDVTVQPATVSTNTAPGKPSYMGVDQGLPVVKQPVRHRHHKAPRTDGDASSTPPKIPTTIPDDQGGSAGSTTAG